MSDPQPDSSRDTAERAVIENINADAAAGIAPGLMSDIYAAIDREEEPDEVDDAARE